MTSTTATRSSTTAAPEMGTFTAGDLLQAVADSTAGKYCRQLDPVIQFARRHPFGSGTILEMHLDRAQDCFDYATRFNAEFDMPVLHGACLDTSLPGFLQDGYAALLTESKTGFQHGVQNVWFEYDAPFDRTPSLFFDIGRDQPFSPQQAWRSLESLTYNFQLSLPGTLKDYLHKLADLNLSVMYYGCMLSRTSESVRLTLNGIEAGNLLQVLNLLEWKGNKAQVHPLMALYLKDASRLVLAVDFSEALGARIGIEVFHQRSTELLPALHANKIIDKEQQLFLSQWEGKILLSPEVSGALYRLYDRTCEVLYKRFNHVKFVLDGEKRVTKVYLYYCF